MLARQTGLTRSQVSFSFFFGYDVFLIATLTFLESLAFLNIKKRGLLQRIILLV
uniref:Uncharacterized protein n=1 Tax=Arundo donax TaxID=35708 RepID=A0A0A8Z1L8_ARUDO